MTVEEGARTVAPGRAAQELELRRDEFRLAVQLGVVRTVPTGEGGRRRVERSELARLRGAPDFPAGLRDRVRTVGTGEAAALLSITPERFTRLARTGHLSPVRFALNRYRAVVWTYLAEEVADFGVRWPNLLTGRLPLDLRERLAAHEDRRPRNWRARRLGLLLRATDDPWARAAAIASLLDPVQVAEVVDDPYERAHLDRLHPPPPSGMPVAAAAREVAERLVRADEPDEILWQRMSLALALDEARARRQAPYPGDVTTGAGVGAPAVPVAPALTVASVEPDGFVDTVSAWLSPVREAKRTPAPDPEPVGVPVPVAAPSASVPTATTEPPVPVPVPASAEGWTDGWISAMGPGLRIRRAMDADVGAARRVVVIPPAPAEPPSLPGPVPREADAADLVRPRRRNAPDAGPGRPSGPDRPPGRAERPRLLDRLRRRREAGAGRTRRANGSVSWP
ncbi:DUF6397 family protein [Streptomyces sp. NPDC051180]|uniref:DUF6397 family protein n=1 Tax=Streptomyces sp. NPDC051180 TaxID=3155797 RepID=UPI00344B14F0